MIKKIPLKEKDIRKQICDYLNLKGYFWFYNLQGLGAFKGLPDIFLVVKGKPIIAIEFKTEKGKLSEHQKTFEQKIEANGGFYFVIKSIEDFLKVEEIIS